MKTFNFSVFLAILIIVACNTNENPNSEYINFEIYETVSQNKLPKGIREKLPQLNIQIEFDTLSAILGYIQKGDSVDFLNEIGNDEIKLLITEFPIDQEKLYFAVLAVKNNSVISNSDIKKTKPNGSTVEIYFNVEGTKKWAGLTKDSIGELLAFTIDNSIYALPFVNGEIKNGVAQINNLENDDIATNISKSINASIKD